MQTKSILSCAALALLVSCGGGSRHKFTHATPLGVDYALITEGSAEKPQKGDWIEFTMEQRKDDETMVLSSKGRQVHKLTDPVTYGDLSDVLSNLSAGDSAIFRLEAKKIYSRGRPSSMDGEKYLFYHVSVREIMSDAEYTARENARMKAEMKADIDSITAYLQREGITGYSMTDHGMFYKVITQGEGPAAVEGELVKVEFDGYLNDNTKFEAREERGAMQFNAGRGQVVRALDEAVLMFNAGSHVMLWVPSKLAYGHEGVEDKVASDQWVWFDVNIHDPGKLLREQQKEIEAYLRARNINAEKDSMGFYYKVDVPGTGPYPTPDNQVKVKYAGRLMKTGFEFDNSNKTPDGTAEFDLRRVVPGWTYGIPKFNAGAKGTLYIPSPLGYGEMGNPPAQIPPNAILIFDIEMISFR